MCRTVGREKWPGKFSQPATRAERKGIEGEGGEGGEGASAGETGRRRGRRMEKRRRNPRGRGRERESEEEPAAAWSWPLSPPSVAARQAGTDGRKEEDDEELEGKEIARSLVSGERTRNLR